MVWGCMTWAGVGGIAIIEGSMNGEKFVEILNSKLRPTVDALTLLPDFFDANELIFQQDNDSKHRLAKNWFDANNVKLIWWPAQ